MIELKQEWPIPIILEAGVNHEGSLKNAFLMIDQAADLGVFSIKFQTYTAERLAAVQSPSYWDLSKEHTDSQFALFKKYGVFRSSEYEELAHYCKEKGVVFSTTFFDTDWLDELDHLVSFYKVASADITNRKLLRRILEGKKPVLLSTGASTLKEVEAALHYSYNVDADARISLLHCVLNYPTQISNANLQRIRILKENFPDLDVGYSDHTVPPHSFQAISTAYCLGAKIIETHFTFDKTLAGNDHYHSLDFSDVSTLKDLLIQTQASLQFSEDAFIASQLDARQHARRGVYALENIEANQQISENALQLLRPIADGGVPSEQLGQILGKSIKYAIPAGAPIRFSDLDED